MDSLVESPWLDTAEAAGYLKLRPKTIREAAARGDLRSDSRGHRCRRRYRREWLDAYSAGERPNPLGATG